MNNRERNILFSLVSSGILIIILLLFDLRFFHPFITIDFKDYSIIYQVQATIAILSPTLISLLSVFNKDKYLGIPISKYIMFIRPGRFNYALYAIILFGGIIIGLAFLLMKLFNSLIFLLLITTLVCLFMVFDCLYLFRRPERARQQLTNYVIDEICNENDEIIDLVNDDIIESLLTNNYVNLEYDIEVLNQAHQIMVFSGNGNEE